MLLVNSGGPKALGEWQACFAEVMPNLPVGFLDDPSIDPANVTYVLVYEPPLGRLAEFANLRMVLSTGAGVDHITRDPAWPRHLPLVRMGGAQTAQRMAEYVCLGALSLLRQMRRVAVAQAESRWDHFETARSATGTRVGVMGLGNLGRPAAEMLSRLGFPVAGWSRSAKHVPGIACYVGREQRDVFLAQADILVSLLPDTPATRGIINAGTIALLPPGAGLVNASRGSHVVLPDLIDALDHGHLSGAVLDVFEQEPLPAQSPVWTHPKILVTPHIASLSTRSDRASYVADVITRFESGQDLPNLYDPLRGY